MLKQNLTGTGVAMVTPFTKKGKVDFNSLKKLTNSLINNGIDFLVVMGTTGEAATLSDAEQQEVINSVKKTTAEKIPIVVGIGGNNSQAILKKIKNFDFTGISAILSVVPYYNKPSQEGIYRHYKLIAKASPRPIILYNVPGRTAVNMTADTCLRLAEDFSNIIAVKEASGNFEQLMKIIKNKPANFQVLSGDDLLFPAQAAIGTNGIISVIGNAFPKEFSTMVNLALAGKFEEAMAMHYALFSIMQNLFAEGNPSGVKAALKIKRIIKNYLRPPLTPISKPLYNKLLDSIKDFENSKQ